MTTNIPFIWKPALIAPLGVPLSITLVMGWESVSNFGISGLRDLSVAMMFVFLFGLPTSYVAMLLFGLPYLMWLRSKGWLSWVSVCVGAVVLGSAIWAAAWAFGRHPEPLAHTIPVGTLIGLVVGVIFSLAAKLQGVPCRNKKAPSSPGDKKGAGDNL
ncbi:MAG: hypothetical protein ABI114_12280 [Rhodanobacter sp.]